MLAFTLACIAPLLLIAMRPVPGRFAPQSPGHYRVVLPSRSVGAGESLDLRVEPTPPPGARVRWSFGRFELASRAALPLVAYRFEGRTVSAAPPIYPGEFPTIRYRAPYVIAEGHPPLHVSVAVILSGESRVRTEEAATDVALRPGSFVGAEDCLGPGQSFLPEQAGLDPSYVEVDELPELMKTPRSLYSHSQVVRGVTDTLPVLALVCRTGRVLDAEVLPSLRGEPGHWVPVVHDPTLVRMAVEEARRYVFRPARKQGEAIAVEVVVFIEFP